MGDGDFLVPGSESSKGAVSPTLGDLEGLADFFGLGEAEAES